MTAATAGRPVTCGPEPASRPRSAPTLARSRQEEARAQLRRQERVRAGIHARGREAAALLEVFRAAWRTGGSARANALFEFCFGGERNQRVSREVLALLGSLEQRAP